ncbi:hypothetical protein GCM10023170_054380 [Phytohabitans houttuyneae]|uniref:Uncharacterized protein n=1 Tax=Phytohabitans houttuyneae TaxID=1076126 RepID=A0A6V8KJE7_9ACTN|nr:hypothetical protein Phou_064490 [Phytohabitans houttuyneae]
MHLAGVLAGTEARQQEAVERGDASAFCSRTGLRHPEAAEDVNRRAADQGCTAVLLSPAALRAGSVTPPKPDAPDRGATPAAIRPDRRRPSGRADASGRLSQGVRLKGCLGS